MNAFNGYGVALPHYNIGDTTRLAKAVEDAGFEYVTLPEVPNDRSAIIRSASIACNTNKIKMGIGILTPYLRHISSIAADAMALDELSKGRFMLGLGAPIWKMAMYGFTVKNLRPLETMREATILLRDLMSGRPTQIGSEFFGIPKGLKMTVPPYRQSIPIFFGVINKLMLRLAGEIADSIELGAVSSPFYTRWAVKQISIGAKHVGRDPKKIPVHGHVLTCIDNDPMKAHDIARPLVAFYFSFLEKVMFTGTAISEQDLEPIKEAYRNRRPEEAVKYVTNKMIDTVGAVGSPEDVIKGLRRYLGTGLNYPSLWGPLGANDLQAVKRLGNEVIPFLPTELKPLYAKE
ncbi:MAG: LLM class flavin-dependent oxidoreductase [Candidatus Ranarchaeia archaeon]